jgi:predicted enzyme related to lactoylglutathione lyase
MGERSSFTPGTFCWTDLSSPDQASAKAFYCALFGWQADDLPIGDDGVVYSMMTLDGRTVCGISAQNENQRAAGMPPIWNSYVAVADVDAAADRAKQLGAELHAPPFDVMDAGRMAVVKDPQGAFVMLWQPNQNRGAELVNAPGAFCWNELYTPDMDASARFYGELFGWSVAPFENSPMPYLVVSNAGRANGGIAPIQEGMPPAWLAYFAVEEIEAGLARVGELGGGTIVGPIDINIAKLGIVRDPQGGVFALYAGQLDD